MITPLRIVAVVAISSLLLGRSASALPAIEGIVKSADGRAVPGAEIRVETADSGSVVKTARTDGSGRYSCSGMTADTYRVTLLVEGAVKASIKNAKIALGDPTQLNFDLKAGRVIPQAQGKHYVWVPTGTGSHIAGRWVEVDEKGNPDTAMSDQTKRSGGELIRRIQDNTTATRRP
jgi:hypothetical protein